jgi:HK97 family phage major capsid protein
MDIMLATEELRTERMRLINEQNAELEATAGRARNGEEQAKIDRIDARITEIDTEVRYLDGLIRREKEAAQLREGLESHIGEVANNQRVANDSARLRKWLQTEPHLRGTFEIDVTQAMAERRLLRQGATAEEIRVLNYQTTAGSLVVPTEMARSLSEYLEAGIAAFRVGATVLNTATGGPLQIPRLSAHSIASGSIPQGTALGGTDPGFARIQLDSYKYSQLVAVSSEFVRDSAFDLTPFLIKDIGRGIARLADADLIKGVGTANPKGMTILAGSGTNTPITTGGSLITPSYEKLVDTVYSVNDAYRANGAAWLTQDANAATLRKLRDGAGGTVGAVMWDPSPTNGIIGGQPDRFLGYPVYTDPNCAAAGSNAVWATFGDFSEYVVRTVGNPTLETDTSVYFATDQLAVRGKWSVDGEHLEISGLNNIVQNV